MDPMASRVFVDLDRILGVSVKKFFGFHIFASVEEATKRLVVGWTNPSEGLIF